MGEVEESKKAYLQLEGELEGKWFALKGKELLATADTNDGLWAKLRTLGVRSLVSATPPRRRREAECLY